MTHGEKEYMRDLEAACRAAKRWRVEHPDVQLHLRFPGTSNVLVIADLSEQLIDEIGGDADSRDFLRALDAACDGRATVLMARVAFEQSA